MLSQFGFIIMKVVAVVLMMVVALASLAQADQRRRYCGWRLEKKLFNLCHGIYNKRAGAENIDIEPFDGGAVEFPDPVFVRSITAAVLAEGGVRERRGIVEECCRRGCSDRELSYYCEER